MSKPGPIRINPAHVGPGLDKLLIIAPTRHFSGYVCARNEATDRTNKVRVRGDRSLPYVHISWVRGVPCAWYARTA